MWLLRLNYVPYYIWMIDATTILDYWLDKDVLGISEDTYKYLLHDESGKDGQIITGQYIESKK